MTTVKVSGNGPLLASIPAILGFVPQDSLILLPFVAKHDGRTMVGMVQRLDLAQLIEFPAAIAAELAANLADQPVTKLVAVVTTARRDVTAGLPLRATVSTVVDRFRQHGFTDLEALFMPRFVPGAEWSSYLDHQQTGVLPDPATSAAAVAVTAAGLSIESSRDDLVRKFTPAPADERARLLPLVTDAVNAVALDEASNNTAALRKRLEAFDDAVQATRYGRLPTTDEAMSELIAAFIVPRLRDAMLSHPTREDELAAENLVLHLWRFAEEPCASHLAGVIAVYGYRRGDWTWSRLAIEAAATPDRLTRLLILALDACMEPHKFAPAIDAAAHEARHELIHPPQT